MGPRDGLQNEATPIPTEAKARFVALLAAAGLREIEATSFVSPAAIPQLADADELMTVLDRPDGVRFPVLVPNQRGMDRAEAAGVDAIAVFTAASDAFTARNIGMTVEESLTTFAPARRSCPRPRLVDARLRLDRVRLPVHRPRGALASRRGRDPSRRAGRGRGLLRRHDRGRRARPGRGTDRADGAGRDPARPRRVSLPRHARHGARQRGGRAAFRDPLLRFGRRRDRRLSVCARRGRQPRHRGPGVPARRRGLGDRGVACGCPGSGSVRRGRARPAARHEGRPGWRMGPGDGSSRRSRSDRAARPSSGCQVGPPGRPASTNATFCYIPARWTVSYSF